MALESHTRGQPSAGSGIILVVEDSQDLRDLYVDVLTSEGFRVETASNGYDAIACARQRPPELVVLDYHLPDLNAPAILKRLRGICGPALPVILVSAAERLGEKADRIHVETYFAKPFVVADFVGAVYHELGCAA